MNKMLSFIQKHKYESLPTQIIWLINIIILELASVDLFFKKGNCTGVLAGIINRKFSSKPAQS